MPARATRLLGALSARSGPSGGAGASSLPSGFQDYIDAVETADGEALPASTVTAMQSLYTLRQPAGGFYLPMVGPRTLAGALVPMFGTLDGSTGLVGGNHDIETGIQMAVNKHIDTGYSFAPANQDDAHVFVRVTDFNATGKWQPFIVNVADSASAGATAIQRRSASDDGRFFLNRGGTFGDVETGLGTGIMGDQFLGLSRTSADALSRQIDTTNDSFSGSPNALSTSPLAAKFQLGVEIGKSTWWCTSRIAHASAGNGIADLAAMQAGVYAYDTAIAAAVAAGDYDTTFSTATLSYLAAVEAADGQALEPAVYSALGTFAEWRIPLGGMCAAHCGARTLAGALVPMVGTAPTGVNLVSGDYNRKRIQLDGSTKYIQSNRNNNADPQDSRHIAWWQYSTFPGGFGGAAIGGNGSAGSSNYFFTTPNAGAVRLSSDPGNFSFIPITSGLYGVFRDSAPEFTRISPLDSEAFTDASVAPLDLAINFGASATGGVHAGIATSLSSFGPHINPTTLEARTSSMVAAIEAALP